MSVALLPAAAKAQTGFDPQSVAYVVCVTDETKKSALLTPPLAKDAVIAQAFRACEKAEAEVRKFLTAQGVAEKIIDERIAQTKKFITQGAETDIDRIRANVKPR